MRRNGTIDFWRGPQGFGFIQTFSGSRVFLHAKQLPERLRALNFSANYGLNGVRVSFDVKADGSGRERAFNIEVLEIPSSLIGDAQ
ncbi:cold-shock protein [Bradyrhizobium sp. USDA 4473]